MIPPVLVVIDSPVTFALSMVVNHVKLAGTLAESTALTADPLQISAVPGMESKMSGITSTTKLESGPTQPSGVETGLTIY